MTLEIANTLGKLTRVSTWCLISCAATACSHKDKPAELASGDEVTVVEVLKGDELLVEKSGRRVRVRLLGVHAFDEVLEHAAVAKLAATSTAYLKSTVAGQVAVVTLGATPMDRYGRYLAYVERGGSDVGRGLVDAGLSMVYTEYEFERRVSFLQAEAEARGAKRQLWGDAELAKMAIGLRRQWSAAGAGKFTDPLLAVPTAEGTEGAAAPSDDSTKSTATP